jgi:hypothetical protein
MGKPHGQQMVHTWLLGPPDIVGVGHDACKIAFASHRGSLSTQQWELRPRLSIAAGRRKILPANFDAETSQSITCLDPMGSLRANTARKSSFLLLLPAACAY